MGSRKAAMAFKNAYVFQESFPLETYDEDSLVERFFELAMAIGTLVLLSPLLISISFFIFFTQGKPIFFKQTRVGKNRRKFQIYKFRTMINGAHKMKDQLKHLNFMSGPFFKIKNDPRLIPGGNFLRKFSLDELPQLFNVIKGEMSLVGPRPMLPDEVDELNCNDIFKVKPGITGLWQVRGRNEIVDFQKKISLDRIYVRKKCFFFDLKIIAKTIFVVLKTRGAC